jgi:multimeric flavodoxin WrbA
MAFNGGPRKKWNTATLLGKALEGAASRGAETRLFHLYDLDFKGCISCFACKERGGKSYGACAVQDDLTPIYCGDAPTGNRPFHSRASKFPILHD